MGAPRDKRRNFIAGPGLHAAMVQTFSPMFIGNGLEKQYQSGMMQTAFGLSAGIDQNVDVHTNGTQNVAGTNISGANQTGSSVTVVGLAARSRAGRSSPCPACTRSIRSRANRPACLRSSS